MIRTHEQFLKMSVGLGLVFGRPFVKRFALCYRSVVCLSVCLSGLFVTFLLCGQTLGRIKMKLGVQVGLIIIVIIIII